MKKIIVIGGGAAGFFAAINAAEQNPKLRIDILERGKEVLQKVKISGGGRCNVTHACWIPKELVKFYPRGGKALLGPFNRFACGDTLAWFEDRGVKLKEEADGRIFPVSNDSQSIVDCLMESVRRAGIRVHTQTRVQDIRPLPEGGFEVITDKVLKADAIVVTPGSSPAVWSILERLGHQVITPVPSLFTFNIKDARIKELAGISVPNATVEVIGQKKLKANGPLLVTHWGMSGPGILKLSAWGARWMHEQQYRFRIRVHWIPASGNAEEVREAIYARKIGLAKKKVQTNQQFDLPARLWKNLCIAAGIDADIFWADLTKQQLNNLSQQLALGEYEVTGKSTFKEEFVTAGGVALDEVNFTRFESKLIPNLFMAGEVLDIDAVTGGFNFQAAWTGGRIIGEAIGGGNF